MKNSVAMRWSITVVVSLWIVSSSTTLAASFWDLCLHPSESGLSKVMTRAALPRLGSKAGEYRVVQDFRGRPVSNAIDCGEACCGDAGAPSDDEKRCDVALFRTIKGEPHCLLITCRQDDPTACDPLSKEGDPRFQNAVMIRLRRRAATKQKAKVRDRLCSPDSQKAACPKGEQCRPNSQDGAYVCRCPHGSRRVASSQSPYGRCVNRPTPTPKTAAFQSKACEFGVGECGPGETCVTDHPHKKNGMCQCKEGLRRNAEGLCENTAAPSNVTSAPKGTVTPPPLRTSTPPPQPITTLSPSSPPSVPLPGTNATQNPPTSKPSVRKLKILLNRNYSIQLPVNNITLRAKVENPPKAPKKPLTYSWSVVSSPVGSEKGVMEGRTTPNFKITNLVVGEYKFKLIVQGRRSYGEARVSLNVEPAKRINEPPQAIVKSATEVVRLPNNLVLDGTQSKDDDKIVDYKWEEVSGPLNKNNLKSTNNGILELKSLTPGDYIFRLTVTDSDGATNSTKVNVTVLKEKDYPPTANAGQNVVLTLPKNSVNLSGKASTDDHGIKSYEWVKVGNDQLTADMTGVREPVLHLTNLQQGDYLFELKVTDTAGQVNTAKVKVYVNPKRNSPPEPNAGGDRTVTLPLKIITLDGSKSKDDEKIVRYEWTQISGPHALTLKNANSAKAEVSNLKVGQYKFRLTCWDKEKLHNTDTMQLTVQESRNQRPKAHAGGDKLVVLPQNLVMLDGTRSWDDNEIVSYSWTRSDDSLAAGTVLNNSDSHAQLLLTALEPGKYNFKLTVTDAEGLHSSQQANLVVKPDANIKNVLDMRFKGNLREFKQSNKADVINQLKLLLTKDFPDGEIRIHIEEIRQIHNSDSLLLRFYVSKKSRTSDVVLDGKSVVRVLRQRRRSGVALLDLQIERLDTAVCQSSCSGHGKCHPLTGRCVCEQFWMENSLRVRYGDGEYNCDWSILYVIVLSCLGVLFVAVMIWFAVWCRRRKLPNARHMASRLRRKVTQRMAMKLRRPRSKRHKYALLNEFDVKDGGLKMPTFPTRNGKVKNRLHSDSDLSSDEEDTLFVNKRPVASEAAKTHHRANGEAGL